MSLTPAGKALKQQLVPLTEEVNTLALRDLDADAIAAVRRYPLVMLDNLAQDVELGKGDSEQVTA